jgi:thiol-disulfide isomerase/thioredoxin
MKGSSAMFGESLNCLNQSIAGKVKRLSFRKFVVTSAVALLAMQVMNSAIAEPAAPSEASTTPVATGSLNIYPQFMAGDFAARNWMKIYPHPLEFSETKPDAITKEPKYKGTPLYGSVKFGDDPDAKEAWIVLDDGNEHVYIDENQDGDLTNDPRAAWNMNFDAPARKKNAAGTTRPAPPKSLDGNFTFPAKWKTGPGKYGIHLYRPKGSLKAYWTTISAPTGAITIDSAPYIVFLYDQAGTGLFNTHDSKKHLGTVLYIDMDGDGTWQPLGHRESADLGEPIQIGQNWYSFECSVDGRTLSAYPAVAPPTVPTVPMPSIGEAAPDFTMTMADGSKSKLSDHKGKVLLVDFWATWCGPCLAAMPKVEALHEKLKDNPNVEFIGLNVMDEKDQFDSWVAKNKGTYKFTFAYDHSKAADDSVIQSSAAARYGINAIPTSFVIGPDGKIVEEISGFTEENEAKVVAALNKLGAKVD